MEDALTFVAVEIDADVIHLGGAGGGPGGGGGGGAGVLGGTGGRGGPGGSIIVNDATRIELGGQPGNAPGGGGGGSDSLAPGSIIRNAVTPTEGRGYSAGIDGSDGGDTTFGDDKGNVIVRAPGGEGGPAGTGTRTTSDLIRVSTMVMAGSWDQRYGLLYLLGAGWASIRVTTLGGPARVGMVMIFECAGVEVGEYSITLRATGPDGESSGVNFPLTVEQRGDILRIPRIETLDFRVSAFGLWTFTLEHDGRVLGTVDLNVKRAGEA